MRERSLDGNRAIVYALGACLLMSVVAIGVALGLAGASSVRRARPTAPEHGQAASEPRPAAASRPRPLVATPNETAARGPAARPATPTSSRPVASAQRAAAAPAPAEESEATVYITRTGEKYHRAGCRYLRQSMIETTLGAAKRGYGPCSVCGPPG